MAIRRVIGAAGKKVLATGTSQEVIDEIEAVAWTVIYFWADPALDKAIVLYDKKAA